MWEISKCSINILVLYMLFIDSPKLTQQNLSLALWPFCFERSGGAWYPFQEVDSQKGQYKRA